ncbi:MAG: DUF1772 domain-containing protein [Pseudomonadota bacterium]
MLEVMNILSTLMLGIFAGALLTEATILVPYWRKMVPADFFRLHGEMGPSLFRYFAPLTTITVLLAISAAVMALIHPAPSFLRLIAGAGAAISLLIFFVYFKNANQSFADHSLTEEELGPELKRWAIWHWIRTIIIVFAFMAALMS